MNKSEEDKKEAERQAARANLRDAFRSIDWIAQAEVIAAQARTARMKFNAARKEGFDVAHSLELCIKPWSL